MEFVLGSDPVRWATGDSPPSPASEFGKDAKPSKVLGSLPLPTPAGDGAGSVVAARCLKRSTATTTAGRSLAGAVGVVFGVSWWLRRRARAQEELADEEEVRVFPFTC